MKFFPEVLGQVPTGSLPSPPEDSSLATSRSRPAARVARDLIVIAVCLTLGWLADRWDLGAFIAPGQFVGYTCAYALGALLVGRWERERGRRVLLDPDDDEEDEYALYATDPSRWADRRGRRSRAAPGPERTRKWREEPCGCRRDEGQGEDVPVVARGSLLTLAFEA